MKVRRPTTVKKVQEDCTKKEVLDYLKLKNLKGGANTCPPPFEIDKKK